jgi:hypothetical protein
VQPVLLSLDRRHVEGAGGGDAPRHTDIYTTAADTGDISTLPSPREKPGKSYIENQRGSWLTFKNRLPLLLLLLLA